MLVYFHGQHIQYPDLESQMTSELVMWLANGLTGQAVE